MKGVRKPRHEKLSVSSSCSGEVLNIVLAVGKENVVFGNGGKKVSPDPSWIGGRERIIVVVTDDDRVWVALPQLDQSSRVNMGSTIDEDDVRSNLEGHSCQVMIQPINRRPKEVFVLGATQ